MKILLSAYACEPYKGSEPSVGWNWTRELAKLNHEVWVLTRTNNKKTINHYYSKTPKPENLFFIYYDLPRWAKWWKKGQAGIHFYYLLWQWFAYKFAKTIHEKEKFDCVHHITFVSIRQPSFMGLLGIPFIFGPVAGGEKSPWRLRLSYGARGIFMDMIRDVSNLFIKIDPLMRTTFKKSHKIFVTSTQTKELVPIKYQEKTKLQLAIGLDTKQFDLDFPDKNKKGKPFKLLYMGRFLYWKGMDIGIRAFALFLKNVPNARLTMVGSGPEKKRWHHLSKQLGISAQVDWIPWVERDQISNLYTQHDLFLFPSLHDSGGMVSLESIAHGLPVICLDIGGPGTIINESCGIKISVHGKTVNTIIEEIAENLITYKNNNALKQKLSIGGPVRIRKFHWNNIVKKIYDTDTTITPSNSRLSADK